MVISGADALFRFVFHIICCPFCFNSPGELACLHALHQVQHLCTENLKSWPDQLNKSHVEMGRDQALLQLLCRQNCDSHLILTTTVFFQIFSTLFFK